jgi:uncharacterized damage-inducible protein DinB
MKGIHIHKSNDASNPVNPWPKADSLIDKTSRLRMFHTIASHTSYHIGQVVMLRQLLGKWPPPSGGLTW